MSMLADAVMDQLREQGNQHLPATTDEYMRLIARAQKMRATAPGNLTEQIEWATEAVVHEWVCTEARQ